jgi:transcriptional regulator with XRE-family HTH domain
MAVTTVGGGLIAWARRAAGLSQSELARRAGTSRPTLSAYEHGRKSPSLDTAERLLGGAGFELVARPRVTFTAVRGPRGRTIVVPDHLPRLAAVDALATVRLPLTLNWSQPGRVYRLAERGERARVYELVLREGAAEDVARYIDGVLLVDLWDELVLPAYVRSAWTPLIVGIHEPGEESATADAS